MVKIFDLLVSLTISEEEVCACVMADSFIVHTDVIMLLQMYPLIQEHVWAKVATEEDLLRTVLDTFIRVSVTVAVESVCELWL